MLIGLVFRVLREPSAKAFLDLPKLSATAVQLPKDVEAIRFSLMRALQGVRSLSLYRFEGGETFQKYMVGAWMLSPAIGDVLIRYGWVMAGQSLWAKAVAEYRLSPKGVDVANDLESWWASLTLGQRVRAVLVE